MVKRRLEIEVQYKDGKPVSWRVKRQTAKCDGFAIDEEGRKRRCFTFLGFELFSGRYPQYYWSSVAVRGSMATGDNDVVTPDPKNAWPWERFRAAIAAYNKCGGNKRLLKKTKADRKEIWR